MTANLMGVNEKPIRNIRNIKGAKPFSPTRRRKAMSEELKPCPYCGGKPVLAALGDDYLAEVHHKINCFLYPLDNIILFGSNARSLDKWNTRHAPEPLNVEEISKLLYESYKNTLGFVGDFPSENNHKLMKIFDNQAKAIHSAQKERLGR